MKYLITRALPSVVENVVATTQHGMLYGVRDNIATPYRLKPEDFVWHSSTLYIKQLAFALCDRKHS